jgi:hypothetical protein
LYYRLCQWASLLAQGSVYEALIDVTQWEPTVPFPNVQSISKATHALLSVGKSSTADQKTKKEAMSKYLLVVGQVALNAQNQFKAGTDLHRYINQ